MLQVCECEAHRTQNHFIRLCQSWRIYGASYVFNSWRQKRKQNEGILSSLKGKLNWKFSIMYIWGVGWKSFSSFIERLAPATRLEDECQSSWEGWAVGRGLKCGQTTVLNCNKLCGSRGILPFQQIYGKTEEIFRSFTNFWKFLRNERKFHHITNTNHVEVFQFKNL